jgi:hypothetical protein
MDKDMLVHRYVHWLQLVVVMISRLLCGERRSASSQDVIWDSAAQRLSIWSRDLSAQQREDLTLYVILNEKLPIWCV